MVATFRTRVHVFGLYIVHCQTGFDLLFSIIMNCVTYSVLYENLTCSISTRLNSPGKT